MVLRQFSFDVANGDVPPPAGMWTPSWVGTTGTFDVQAGRMRLQTAVTGSYGSRVGVMSNVPLTGDFDIILRVTPGQAWTNECYFQLNLGAAWSAAPNGEKVTDGFDFITDGLGVVHYLSERDASADTQQLTTAHTYSASVAQWMRLTRRGNIVTGTIWADGTAMPAKPDVSLTSVTPKPNTPLFLALSLVGGNASAAARIDVDMLSVDDLRPPFGSLASILLLEDVAYVVPTATPAASTPLGWLFTTLLAEDAPAAPSATPASTTPMAWLFMALLAEGAEPDPDIDNNEIWLRAVGDTGDGERVAITGAQGVADLWAVASGVAYELRVKATRTNGAFRWSEWVAAVN